ncbi:16S rRNA (guanine(966)-N(2))-methyltransferase RsmD [Massilia sp. W12]|uniref:16S rRNA (guanine(966)-N(2))-methyltransferase RsmD n=1 Tax=Massilia sp. W12 TaxID=3126507 RepID=UPI0030D2DA2F
MKTKTTRPTSAAARRPQQVRIIGGAWKRTPLPVHDAEGLRPTPDRVRETLFNWLNFLWELEWEHKRVLDLFAGSGALGFEAASRGAAQVVLCENQAAACRQLRANQEKLQATQIQILQGDAFLSSARLPGAFDLIFIDPPYQLALWPRALESASKLLAQDGLVYLELPKTQEIPPFLADWTIVRSMQAGMVACYLLCRNNCSRFA